MENNAFGFPILSLVVWFPTLGALFILFFMKKTQETQIKWVANIITFVGFLISLPLWFAFDNSGPQFQFLEKAEWIPTIGVSYQLGMDGISLLLVMMTTLLGFIAVLSSWNAITDRIKQYYIFLLLLQTGMLGVFVTLDFFLFYVFWEVMLVPMYFLIGVWGGPRKLYAAIKFFLYTLVGSVLMLLGILAIYFAFYRETGIYTFDITQLWTINYPELNWVFWAFFIGFAIKVPMFPFHTWLPDAHVEAPTAGSVILAGVLLKMGTYGFVRFSIPMLPEASQEFGWYILVLAVIGIIYGALVALVQSDWKKLVAYSSVSHLGFVMLGVFALTELGLQGGILQMVNHGLATGGLFLIVGIMYEQTHTREIAAYGGIAKVVPVFAALFLIIALASMGLPLLNGFIGEFMILQGTFASTHAGPWYALFAVSGIVLGAAYLLWLYQRVMFGEIDNPENEKLKDVTLREQATLVPLVVLCIWIGVYPKPFLAPLRVPVEAIMARINGTQPASVSVEEPATAAVPVGN
ncbi:MAG: NADH-quinone oxidoreductase subunit M [Acidobacteria bacterium]|nr:MAG: NADH-quinone oxidoreductase subunit M [Acidobacteriota bacterium]